ncbi:MAG: condensation domain-containing protein, partial [Cyanobacteriota bacterium]
ENIKIVNLYGPTETTINATYHVIDSILDDSVSNIPIGIPSSNLKCIIHFLNDNIDLASQEEIGELWVSGIGLTSGYINSIDLNNKKFIIDELNTRYYRTGDLVSQNKKGEYIFHGRIDQQIKIRGFRVEIGEIENILLTNNKISNVVIKFENNLLSCFIESETLEKDDISNYLANKLPEYLIPNKIVMLKKFPLMENGKIDINNIKEDDTLFIQKKELSNTELIISKIWAKLLNIKIINSDISFFSLGGDSILIMQMFLKLEEYFTKLPKISAFYKNVKLSYLATLIDDLNKSIILEEEIPKKDDFNNKFGLSPSQIGFFLVNKFTKKQDTSWKAVFCIEGKIDLKNFQKALNLITKRHQMLNVKLVSDTIPYFQMEENIINFPFIFEEKNSEEKKLIDINTLIPNLINNMDEEQINLNEWPLLKLKLIKASESEFLLSINSHHILGDALSILILLKELSYTYTMLQLEKKVSLIPLKNQFSDYVNLVNNGLEVDKIASLNYWKNIFELPYKKPELEIINDTFFKYKEKINKNSFKSLKELSISFDTPPFNLILTIFYRALSKFLNEEDLVIGIAHHGRDFSLLDINKIFGCFAKSIPIRIKYDLELENQVKNIHNNIKESSFFELNTIELIKEISSGVNFNTLLGSQFFLSYIDLTEEENQDEKLLKIDWEKSYSDFEPSNLSNDIFLAVKKNNNELTLSFNLSNFYDKERFITLFKDELAFITNNNKTKSDIIFNYEKLNKENFGILDSALIGYLPSNTILNKLDISEAFLKQSIFKKEKSIWLEGIKSNLGNTGFISIPFFAEEINLANSKIIIEHIFSAIEQAKNLGAKYISLAGMLPAITEYGKCLSEIKIPIITTGHSTTVSAVIKNTVAILDKLKIDVTSKTIAFIGLGSIGTATALTLLNYISHPKKIILCDIYGSEKRIKEIELFLKKELFFNGIIEGKISSKNISDSIYEADIMICAVSSSNILDINKLKQNCIVIDDSFPHCFDVNNAIERMEISKDIFVIGGGLLDIGNFERIIYLPFKNEVLKEYLTKNIISNCIASCQLESLLMVKNPQLNITTGLVEPNQVLEYISVINSLEIKPSVFHLGNYLLK